MLTGRGQGVAVRVRVLPLHDVDDDHDDDDEDDESDGHDDVERQICRGRWGDVTRRRRGQRDVVGCIVCAVHDELTCPWNKMSRVV